MSINHEHAIAFYMESGPQNDASIAGMMIRMSVVVQEMSHLV